MSMSKQDFVALADAIRLELCGFRMVYDESTPDIPVSKVIDTLASFCKRQNPNFMRERWIDYIAGKCGKNGGTIKPHK